jgi:hypothetical protein
MPRSLNKEKADGLLDAGMYSFKSRQNARIGRTNSKSLIRNSCNTRNKVKWKCSNQKK